MTRDDIIELAREAGYFLYDLTETHGTKTVETDDADQWAQLERFAKLVAAAEREACAKLVFQTQESDDEYVSLRETIALAIRARGE